MTDLKEFWIRRTSLNGTIPTEIGNCRNLERLVLSRNYLSGALPSELGNLKKLSTSLARSLVPNSSVCSLVDTWFYFLLSLPPSQLSST